MAGQFPSETIMRMFCAGLLMMSLTAIAQALDYPTRHITVIAPAGAGAPPDTILRIIADPMSRALGQQVVVENVPASGGIPPPRPAPAPPPPAYPTLMTPPA